MAKIIKLGIQVTELESCECNCGCEFKVQEWSEILKGPIDDAKLKCPNCGCTGRWDLTPTKSEVPVEPGVASKDTQGVLSLWVSLLIAALVLGFIAWGIWMDARPQ